MVIVVTGDTGVGKTTVCRSLVAMARSRGDTCGGIISHGTPEGLVVEDIASGETEALAGAGGTDGAGYRFRPEGIEFALKAVARGASADALIVDEIGYFEHSGRGFAPVLSLIEGGKMKEAVIVVPSELLPAFRVWMPTAPVFPVTVGNRERLPGEIDALLFRELGSELTGAV